MVEARVDYTPKKCAWCNGTGRETGMFGGDTCPVCNGQGSVLVATPAQKCASCNGTGEETGMFGGGKCPSCGGTGWAHVMKP